VVFKHAQQLGLRGNRHLTDLIQQQRTFFRQLKASGAPLHGAGESAFFVAKDLAFNQVSGIAEQ